MMLCFLQRHRSLLVACCVGVLALIIYWVLHGQRQTNPSEANPLPDRVKGVLLSDLYFAEGPRWHKGSLYFSDFGAYAVYAVNVETLQRKIVAPVPDPEELVRGPSGLGWKPDGTLLVSQMRTRKLLAFKEQDTDRKPEEYASLAGVAPEFINDMVVDMDGNAYVGNFGFDLTQVDGQPVEMQKQLLKGKETCLTRVDSNGTVSAATPNELLFPNGVVITPDGKTLLVAETFGHRISAYSRAADGSLSNRRTWADIPYTWPDGMCLDAYGAVWVALAGAGAYVRLFEKTGVVEVIPSQSGFKPIAVMLGGADGRTLFMLEARVTDAAAVKAAGAGNSRIMTTKVDVPGATSVDNPNYYAGYC